MSFAKVVQGFDHNGVRFNAGDVGNFHDDHLAKLLEDGYVHTDMQDIAWSINAGGVHVKPAVYDRVKFPPPGNIDPPSKE